MVAPSTAISESSFIACCFEHCSFKIATFHQYKVLKVSTFCLWFLTHLSALVSVLSNSTKFDLGEGSIDLFLEIKSRCCKELHI